MDILFIIINYVSLISVLMQILFTVKLFMSIRIIYKCSWLCYFFNLNDTEWIIYKIWNGFIDFLWKLIWLNSHNARIAHKAEMHVWPLLLLNAVQTS